VARARRPVWIAAAALAVVALAAAPASAQPSTPELTRGIAALERGDLTAARAAFDAQVRAHPRDARGPFYVGVVLARQNDAAGAERQYRAALRLDATLAEAHNNLGLVLRAGGRLDDALASFREAVRLNARYGEAQYNLGLALEEKGDRAGAATAYRAAAAASPRDADARNALGALLLKGGDAAGARAAFEDAARVAPRDALPHVNLGLLHLEAGRAADAERELDLALRLAGDARPALHRIGNGFRRLAKFDKAVSTLERAAATGGDPTPALLCDLGLALKGAGRAADAVRRFEESIARDARYAPAHYLLGNALAGAREWRRAAESYQRFLQLDPQSPQAEEARRRLQICRTEQRRAGRRR